MNRMFKKGILSYLLLFLFLNFSCSQNNFQSKLTSFEYQTFVAKVIRIIDGDTMEVLYEETPIKIEKE